MPRNLKVYQTDHSISQEVCNAFAQGANGQLLPAATLVSGNAAMYGILRGTGEIINECEEIGRDYYYIDHGYFDRSEHKMGDFTGSYRVELNANQCVGNGDHKGDRWHALNIRMDPWKKGDTIIVCPLSKNVGTFLGIAPNDWMRDTIKEIVKHTDRPIEIKKKDSDLTIGTTLKGAHCVVAYNSFAMVEAILHGIPAFHTGPACVAPVALSDLSKIETPIYPERLQWASNLAYNQWTLEEMRNGTCWRMLNESV